MAKVWSVIHSDYDEHSTLATFNHRYLANQFLNRLHKVLKKSTRPSRLRSGRILSYHREAWYYHYDTWMIYTQIRLASDNVFRRTLYISCLTGVDNVPLVRLRRPKDNVH